ncbi:uncharacterized protein LOC142992030 [Genypterus blacodes]|uniref:uncharacterized protein LOC142992030 n=1 Tax=Genypterus blacodes TaxID=154954 RepID=UPI003F764AC5
MKLLELDTTTSRFRVAHCGVGLAGCLCVSYAVWTPLWINGRGLWSEWAETENDPMTHKDGIAVNAVEAERVFGVLAFLMALSTAALCLVFACCWTSETALSYSNTRALLMVGQALYPTTLLLLTTACTGFFFLLSWSLFTYEHRVEIGQDFTCLGSSYWLGALGWSLLLVVEFIVFIAEQAIVPDILPDLEKAVETWRNASQQKFIQRPFSDSYRSDNKKALAPKRVMSAP